MKISISLPAADIEYLDDYAKKHSVESRSAAVQRAVRLLRERDLSAQYEASMEEWIESGEAEVWDVVAGDGLAADAAW